MTHSGGYPTSEIAASVLRCGSMSATATKRPNPRSLVGRPPRKAQTKCWRALSCGRMRAICSLLIERRDASRDLLKAARMKPAQQGAKIIAPMREAFLDESSSTASGEPVLIVAGFVSEKERWAIFEENWRETVLALTDHPSAH